MKRFALLMVIFVFGALALVACGGSEPATPAPVDLSVEGTDAFTYDPSSLSIPTGATVNLTFTNSGGLDHNFVVVNANKDPLTVTDSDAIGGITTGTVSAGEATTFTFTAPPAGTYKYVCTTPGHAAGGMVGDLTVTP